MLNEIKAAIKLCLITTSYAGVGYVCWIGGMKSMHNDLTGDMRRNNDAPIPAVSKSGKFYLYSETTTFAEWRAKQD